MIANRNEITVEYPSSFWWLVICLLLHIYHAFFWLDQPPSKLRLQHRTILYIRVGQVSYICAKSLKCFAKRADLIDAFKLMQEQPKIPDWSYWKSMREIIGQTKRIHKKLELWKNVLSELWTLLRVTSYGYYWINHIQRMGTQL